MIWELEDLRIHARDNKRQFSDGWYPARPLPVPFVVRLRAAWMVFAGKADAVIWPKDQ